MREAEFDAVANAYEDQHAASIRFSGETPEYFARYKIDDVAREMGRTSRETSRILDFGGGTGNALPHLAAAFPGAGIVLLDPSAQSLSVAESRFPGTAVFREFDGLAIPYGDDRFDLIFTACVFHHIPAAAHGALLREILRVLRPGGSFFVFEHNPRNPLTRHAVRSCPFDENAVLIDAADMAGRVAEAGFVELKRVYRVFFPGRLAALRPLERFLGGVPIGGQYYVRALKPS